MASRGLVLFDPETDGAPFWGDKSEGAGDDDFVASFLATFVHPLGKPLPGMHPHAAVACSLHFDAIMIFFAGIPSSNAIPSSAKKIRFRHNLKLPFGVMAKALDDDAFQAKVSHYTFSGQKEAMLAASPRRCNCCGKGAVAFVSSTWIAIPDGQFDALATGLTMISDPVFPVCEKIVCNRELGKFMNRCRASEPHKPKNKPVLMCGYAKCRKIDVDANKFRACARCEMRQYCCRQHQKADWNSHKKICKPEKK